MSEAGPVDGLRKNSEYTLEDILDSIKNHLRLVSKNSIRRYTVEDGFLPSNNNLAFDTAVSRFDHKHSFCFKDLNSATL